MAKESTTIEVGEEGSGTRGKAPLMVSKKGEKTAVAGGYKRGIAIFDFLLRLAAITATLAAAAIMGTTQETLPFFTQFLQFQAEYSDIPTFEFFVIAMAIVAGYVVLSLPLSIVAIVRPLSVAPRLLLLIFDTAAITLNTAAASASAAIVYLAHNGNPNTNWLPICQQFGNFCQNVSGAVVAAFIAVVFFAFMIIISAVALKQH